MNAAYDLRLDAPGVMIEIMSEVLSFAEARSMDAEAFRVHHLAELLQKARARARVPEQRGYGTREHVGVTQEDMAELLAISDRQYRSFEHGRLAHPDPRFLDRVARTLGMSQVERQTLESLAARQRPHMPATAEMDLTGLQSMLDAMQVPAIVTDLAWDYVAWNRLVNEYLLDPATVPVEARNSILLGFGPVGAARFPTELPDLGALVGRVRAAYLADGGICPVLRDMVERLMAIPAAAAYWQDGPLAAEPACELRVLVHPQRGPIRAWAVRTMLDDGLRLTQFIPDKSA